MSREEPEIPSIQTPLGHEHQLVERHGDDHTPADHALENDPIAGPPAMNALRTEPATGSADERVPAIAALAPPPDLGDPSWAVRERRANAPDRAGPDIDQQLPIGPQPLAAQFEREPDRDRAGAAVSKVCESSNRKHEEHISIAQPVSGRDRDEPEPGNGWEP